MAMTLAIIAIISIIAFTGAVRVLNRLLPRRLCAVCAGVSVTWLWMIGARWLGYQIDPIIPAVLMGGSVVGAAYQLENKLPINRSPLLWKTLFIPLGFLAVYSLLSWRWISFTAVIFALAVVVGLFFVQNGKTKRADDDKQVLELEKEMDKCC